MTKDTIIDATATEVPAQDRPASEKPASPASHRRGRRGLAAGVAAGAVALGTIGLSVAQPARVTPTPVQPVAISALTASGATAVKGQVAEIFGNKFIVQDGSGRALVETGRQGESGTLVAKGDTVTVQGRFENGFLHARVLTKADGTALAIGPAGGPPPGTLGWAKDKAGFGPRFDVPAMTASVEKVGYSDVRVAGQGPRHLEVAAKGRDGAERMLHVDVDGSIREKPLR